MLKCSKEAFAACPDRKGCSCLEEAVFTEGSECDKFNRQIGTHKMTHADQIRAMSDEMLAVYITSIRVDTINEICKEIDVEIEMPTPTVENTVDVCEWLR